MSVLCKYAQGDKARFDFRIADGLGNFVEPDWEDPGLKVEFWDAKGTMRFQAGKTSSPPLTLASDRYGPFVAIEGIELADFSLGVASARIFCKVSGNAVLPQPTIIEAFEVVAGTGLEPAYTNITRVRNELPLDVPSQLSDAAVSQFIHDASRKIDAALHGYYELPFPGIEENPCTPALIERLARKLALADCLAFLGVLNQAEFKSQFEEQALSELERLRKGELRLSGNHPPLSVYQGDIFQDEPDQADMLD